jgi:predicted NBD/HSP70 family sugar kinase
MALRSRSANRDLMRRMNEALVLGIVHDFGPIARTEIAELSGLSLATISSITGALIDQGIVIEESAGESTGGRRPILLAIDRPAGLVFGVKLTESQIIVALTDLGAELVELRSAPLGAELQPEQVVETLGTVIDELRAAHPGRRFLGLGLGMAGIVDRERGICRYSPFLPWRDLPLRDLIEARVGLPVIVENDVNALTLAERWFGSGAGAQNFLVVTLGRGVGMGLMLNGELYRGGGDGAGEFGHITVVEHGPVCNCGKRGCIEAFVSESALAAAAQDRIGRSITLAEAITEAQQGNEAIRQVFNRAGYLFGLALSGVINVLNPTLIILGGEGTHFIDLLRPSFDAALREHTFAGFFDDAEIVIEPWGDDAWARGAAGLMLDAYFHPPDARAAPRSPTDAIERTPSPRSQTARTLR